MPNTYVALRTETVTGSPVSSVTLSLSGISGYTDLRLVIGGTTTVTGYAFTLGVNGDTGSNYSQTLVSGSGSAAQSARYSNANTTQTYIGGWVAGYDSAQPSTLLVDFMNYSNTTTNKTILYRSNSASRSTEAGVMLWRNTAAITSITIYAQSGSNIAVGSTFSLYGIANADQGAAKATGGIITEDSQYWYHTFGASGTFTPKQALSVDYLVVAGGGGGGCFGGGGGGGGYKTGSGFSVASGTPISVTVGAGGAGSTSRNNKGSNGSASVFSSNSTTGGGGGGSGNPDGGNGAGGGSGGGASGIGGATGGSRVSGEGFVGGNYAASSFNNCAGGGGASAAGGNGTDAGGGNGGAGISSSISGLSVTYAGGGGGGADNVQGAGGAGGGGAGGLTTGAVAGTTNLGGGGGGTRNSGTVGNGAAGGSGVVIIRYSK